MMKSRKKLGLSAKSEKKLGVRTIRAENVLGLRTIKVWTLGRIGDRGLFRFTRPTTKI